MNRGFSPKHFILDVDGVLTDGQFHYTSKGKTTKIFGPDDNDALCLLKKHLDICLVTGDKRGFFLSKKRVVDDMGFPLYLVSTFERADWIKEKFDIKRTIYMGDGLFDVLVFDKVGYSIAPANAFYKTKEFADFITNSGGGNRAVAEACLHIMEKFFEPFDPLDVTMTEVGVWKKKLCK